jgi:2-methylisocitrate lyase-like PEP mutase family enzyme
MTTIEKRARFRALHTKGCFVLPNPWDIGSARMLERLGFEALASTSAGFAWTMGNPDYAVQRDDVLQHLTAMCRAVDLPVNADLEAGFASSPEGVADTVRLAIETGVAGLSIEDRDVVARRLFDTAGAIERLRAALGAIRASGHDVILVARTELLLDEPGELNVAIDKLVAFADAGADCLYAPGVRRPEDIQAMVRAVAPKPVNVLVMDPAVPLAAYADLGVRRVSLGGSLARVGWAATMAAAREMLGGSFQALVTGAPSRQLNEMFSSRDG